VKGLIIHPETNRQIDNFLNKPSHALLLSGQIGSGKVSLARDIATKTLNLDASLDDYPYKLIIGSEETSIGIEPIRQLDSFLSLKVPRTSSFNRVVIIENAHNLTIEAQNALLKTLEEPPVSTLIILTSSNTEALLPTITSRTQVISVKKPAISELTSYFKTEGYDQKDIDQAYSISGGLPGLMTALLSQSDHVLVQATDIARQFLKSTFYERLLMVDDLAKQKELAISSLFIMQQMAHVSLQTAAGQPAKKWLKISSAAYTAEKELNMSVQPKLALTNLALAL
jgi:DNA polymerase III subunit delta'